MAKDINDFSAWSCFERNKIYNNLSPSSREDEPYRRWYQHDIDQIVYSGAFRKLQKKAQLLSRLDPRCRSRLIHTLEVVRIAKEISEILGLNAELTEAIALAHDLGNVAYGKPIHDFLSGRNPDNPQMYFCHEEASRLMLLSLTRKPLPETYETVATIAFEKADSKFTKLYDSDFPHKYVNISQSNSDDYFYYCISPEVLDGVVKHGPEHGKKYWADTLEGQVVAYADNIAYLSQDIDDFLSTKIMEPHDIKQFHALSAKDLTVKKLTKTWEEVNRNEEPLDCLFRDSRSERLGALIRRFIKHNLKLRQTNSCQMIHSEIMEKDIPKLEVDCGLDHAINACWEFIGKFYSHPLVKSANIVSMNKVQSLWHILTNGEEFKSKNKSYINFMKLLDDPLYDNYKNEKNLDEEKWNNWKNAYFLAHLSEPEMDQIIDLFQKRNYSFDLDI